MSKQEKKTSYYVDMSIDLKKIENLPPDVTAGKIFTQVCIGAVVKVSKQQNGIPMQDQRRLYSLRNSMENAVTIGEISKTEIAYDDFKFLMRMWETQMAEASGNELLMLVEDKFKKAEENHDKENSNN